MKVVHVFSAAGIAELLSYHMGKSMVLKIKDKFNVSELYGTTIFRNNRESLIEAAEACGRSDKTDKIVLHDYVEYMDRFPKHKLYIYFHGSKLRSLEPSVIREVESSCRGVFLSTPDLLKYYPKGKVIPQPIDLLHFRPLEEVQRLRDWFTILKGYKFKEKLNLIEKTYPDVVARNRDFHTRSYGAMPYELSSIINYIDMKYLDKTMEPVYSPSCTGLQALACGCKVWTHDGQQLSKSLLNIHDSNKVSSVFKKCLEDQNFPSN